MKKAIPALIAILLIMIIAGAYGYSIYKEKYSYSNERMDQAEYFGVTSDDEAAVIMGDELQEYKAAVIDGECYLDMDVVLEHYNDRFYFDENEGLVIYVEPLTVNVTHVGQTGYDASGTPVNTPYVPARYVGDRLCLACEFVKAFTNYEYTYFQDPGRIQVYTEWPQREVARVTRDTKVRYRGGIKSPILTDVSEGDTVYVLDAMDTWSEVKTEDGYIGYLENKRLDDYDTIDPIPVTSYVEPEFKHVTFDQKINMAWAAVAGKGGNDTIMPLMANTHDVNVLSPTWFPMSDNFGGLEDRASAEIVSQMHDRGIQVWPTFNNFDVEGVDAYVVLSSTTTRNALTDNVMNMVAAYGLDGVNIDFEDLSYATGTHFVEFIRELSVRCRQAGVVLSVDNYVPLGNTDYYGRSEQGAFADYVIVMGYDEHYAGSEEAGSVAGISYVEQGIKRTVEEVGDAARVINGIPFYTRIWKTEGTEVSSRALGMQDVADYLSEANVTTSWDQDNCQNYGERIISEDVREQVWIEDAESIEVKLNVMDNYGLGGVASWRLGFETPDIWDVIADYVNK